MPARTLYSRKAKIWGAAMRLAGFERGIRSYLHRLALNCPKDSRILDVGCGTGIVGLVLAERFPNSTLLATDIEEKFLQQARRNAGAAGFNGRVSFGVSNIDTPDVVEYGADEAYMLGRGSFDIVSMGGVLGYSSDQHKTIAALAKLVKPRGYLINLEMNETPIGKIFSYNNKYHPIPLADMGKAIAERGYDISFIPFSLAKDFPVSVTRIGIIARKTG